MRHLVFAAVVAASASAATADQYLLAASWASQDVRRYTLDGAFAGTFISAGSGGLGLPDGMSYGPDGHLYVSDALNDRVLRYDGTSGAFLGVAASQNLVRAGFNAFGPDGYLYVCSADGDNKVHKFDPQNGAWLGSITAPGMTAPTGIAWNDGTMYVSAFGANRVFAFDADTGASLGALARPFARPMYLRFGGDGNLWVNEYGANRISRVNILSGALVGTVTTPGLSGPVGQVGTPDGGVLVASWNNGRVYELDGTTGAFRSLFIADYPNVNDLLITPDFVPSPGCTVMLAAAAGWRRRRANA